MNAIAVDRTEGCWLSSSPARASKGYTEREKERERAREREATLEYVGGVIKIGYEQL